MSILDLEDHDYFRVLDDDGSIIDESRLPRLSDDEMLDLYTYMILARRFDQRTISLNRQGRIGSFPPLYGHEAAQVASAFALDQTDWIVPSYRDHAAHMVHGVDLKDVLLYYMGHVEGNHRDPDSNVFTINGSVGSQALHATGIAWAMRLREEQKAVMCYFGDGATSEGSVHEAMNFAGVFDTPTVFFCQNNQWAISVPRENQTAAETLAQKASAYGFDGVQVDGMDPLAVYAMAREMLEKAKQPPESGQRPAMIEAMLYRLGPHSTSDDPSEYRDPSVTDKWKDKDPIPRFRTFLIETGRLDSESDDALQQEAEETISTAIEDAESLPRPEMEELFSSTFAEMTDELSAQYEWLCDIRDRHGEAVYFSED